MSKKGVIYARFSDGPDQNENSIIGQLRECVAFAKSKGITIIHEYIDRGISGKNDKRPQFLEMIKDSERQSFDYVIVYKMDRFSRDKYDSARYKHKLKKNMVRVLSAAECIPDGPEGIILESVLEGMAEYYSADLSQKVIRGLYNNGLECKSIGGRTAFGYKVENANFVIDENKAPIVREIFIRYANGESNNSIYTDLNERGIKTQLGNEFNKNSLGSILKNPKYIGTYQYKAAKNKKYEEGYEYKDIYAENGIPAIIDKNLFEKVGRMLKLNSRKKSKINAVDFILSDKLFDGECGGKMVGESGTSKSGKKHCYYKCMNNKINKTCDTKAIRKDNIEEIVVDVTKERVLKDDVIAYIGDCIVDLQKDLKDDGMVLALKNQLSAINQKLNNILKAIEDGIYNDTTRERMTNLEKQKKEIENSIEIEKFKRDTPKITKERAIYWLETFKDGNIHDYQYQKQIIDTLINSVLLYKDKIVIAYNYSNETEEVILKGHSDGVRNDPLKWRIGDSNS